MILSFNVPNAVCVRAVANFPEHTVTIPAVLDEEGEIVTPEHEEVTATRKQVAYESLKAHLMEWFKNHAGGAINAAKAKEEDEATIGTLEKEHRALANVVPSLVEG